MNDQVSMFITGGLYTLGVIAVILLVQGKISFHLPGMRDEDSPLYCADQGKSGKGEEIKNVST